MIDLTALKKQLQGKPLAIVGLGKSGLPVFEACRKAGIDTVLWDDNEEARQAAIKIGAKVEDIRHSDFTRFGLLCLSPGIPLTHPKPHPAVIAAQKASIEIVGDIEIFHRVKPTARTIGITGTNGKSTTTALIGHILKESGVSCAVGGNIGEAILTLPDLPDTSFYVIEMSSYQLDLCATFSPSIAVLINLSPDHLDRHGDMQGYIAAKKRIFRGKGTGIATLDDPDTAALYGDIANSERDDIAVSVTEKLIEGVCVSPEGILRHHGRDILDLKTCPSLQGQHNWQNAAVAYAACFTAGLTADKISAALRSFPGLAHRQNIVAQHQGVTYINDSKATNDQAAAQALRTFNPIYWIAGGKTKGGGYTDCEKHLDHIRHAFLIGTAEEEIAQWLSAKKIPFTRCGTLEKATDLAHALAQSEKLQGATVLLSPACASFDQFRSFEHRGEVFVARVQALTSQKQMSCKGPKV